MRRTFNYTDRRRIKASSVAVAVSDRAGEQVIDADLDLSLYRLPSNARVYLEAYYRTSFMRFDCGTVATLAPPAGEPLSEIPGQGTLRFRVKVVDESGAHGRIIALADGLAEIKNGPSPDQGGQHREPLLPVRSVDLGEEVWRLLVDDPEPVLEVNDRIENAREMLRSDTRFSSLVFPEVVRRVLMELLLIRRRDLTTPDDLERWERSWIRFIEGFQTTEPPRWTDNPDAIADCMRWIDETVQQFCSRRRTLTRFTEEPSER